MGGGGAGVTARPRADPSDGLSLRELHQDWQEGAECCRHVASESGNFSRRFHPVIVSLYAVSGACRTIQPRAVTACPSANASASGWTASSVLLC